MTVMLAPVETRLITGDELLVMGDIGLCELIDGRIVPMAPTGSEHGMVEINVAWHLKSFVQPRQLGWVTGGETGIYTRRAPDRVRGIDVAFISRGRLPQSPPKGFLTVAPELIVEVMSPDDRWQDVRQKLEEYFAIGTERVWIVEPENRAVLVYSSPVQVRRLSEADTLEGEGVLEGFSLPVASIFEE